MFLRSPKFTFKVIIAFAICGIIQIASSNHANAGMVEMTRAIEQARLQIKQPPEQKYTLLKSPYLQGFSYLDLFKGTIPKPVKRKSRKRIIYYSVQIENNLQIDLLETTKTIQKILQDGRSWSGKDRIQFIPAIPAKKHLNIIVASPRKVNRFCRPLRTNSRFSCSKGNRVVLNVKRWKTGVRHWTKSIFEYRAYLVNHEVGHFLGHRHKRCHKRNAPAPVMMQQTKSFGRCQPNGWPYPHNQVALGK
ncbi:MAG: hypothetical protein COB90_10195 [Hyphomicrobiales bacterium]|nr:MAG: hypothetical protein COB90_10195 [Hyphomicrobiales bacterium]